jgi:hypothetical protein
MKGFFGIVVLLAILVLLLAFYWGVSTSDLPEWFKFALLR